MSEKLLAGLQLMVFGMGMVYVFLIIMIFCMKIMSRIVAPIAARQKAAEEAQKAAAAKPGNAEETALAAAAVAAVAASRR